MNIEKRSTRTGAAIILFAVLLRLMGGMWTPLVQAEIWQTTFFPRVPQGGMTLPETTPTPPATEAPTQPPILPEIPTFVPGDVGYIQMYYAGDCGYRPDLAALLQKPLSWELASGEPTVLILHSHATESYTMQPGEDYDRWGSYRTTDTDYNMVSIGDALAALLEAGGITVLHDRQLHDNPSYSSAYSNSYRSVQAYLEEYPSIRVVLDLHRDAALNADGSQYATSAMVDGQKSAQVMFVVGTNATGGKHPDWQENLAVALKLQVLMEKRAPGITRTTCLRGQTFNHELSPGAMIVEVGTAGNTRQEALRAVPILAEAIFALAYGANG